MPSGKHLAGLSGVQSISKLSISKLALQLSMSWKLFILGAIIIGLTGCVAVPSVHMSRSADDYRKEPRGEGLLVLSTVVNTSEVGQVTAIRLQHLDAPVKKKSKQPPLPPEYVLTNTISGKSRDLSLFFNSLPAGKYKIIEINFGMKYLSYRADSPISDITIEAGKTLDLGMMMITSANMKVLVGRSKRFSDNKLLINRYFANDNLLKDAQPGGWQTPISQNEIAELFAVIHPQGINSLTENKAGEVLAGTSLGTIIARNNDGKWRVAARTDTYDPITLIAANPKANKDTILAFTDIGEAYLIENEKAKKVSTGNLPSGNVFFIHSNPQETQWFAAVKHDDKSELLTATSLDGDWKTVYSDDIKFSTWSGQRFSWAAKLPNGFVVASSINPEIRCFDFSTQKWTSISVPNKRTLLDVKANSVTGSIGILTGPGGGIAGAFATPLFAESCGAAWRKIETPYQVQVAAPIGMNNGNIAVIGGVFGDAGIYVSADGGKIWTKRTDKSVLAEHFYQTNDHGLFIISNGRDGLETVLHSADDGTTWNLELSNFDQWLNNSGKK